MFPAMSAESFDYCNNLNNAKFTSLGSYFVRLYNQEGDDFEFTGEVDGHDINGKARKSGNNFKILSGNVTGKFTLIDNCMNLTGNFKTKKYSFDISFDYTRSK